MLPAGASRSNKMSHPGYYSTLQERIYNTAPENVDELQLDMRVSTILDSLFITNTVRLSIPQWLDNDNDLKPTNHYVIQFASRINRTKPLFFEPYDPLVVTRYKEKELLSVIDARVIYSRDEPVTNFIVSELQIMAENPRKYFKEVGKRWSKCLICNRDLTAVDSIKRAMGKVCYSRVRDIAEDLRNLEEIEDRESNAKPSDPDMECEYGCDIETNKDEPEVISKMPMSNLLNPIEISGLNDINSKLQRYSNIGAIYNSAGFLTVEPQTSKINAKVNFVKGMVEINLENKQDRWELRHLVQKYPKSQYDEKTDTWSISNRTYNLISDKLNIANFNATALKYNIRVEDGINGILVYNFPFSNKEDIKNLSKGEVIWLPDIKAWQVPNQLRADLNKLINKLEGE